VRVLVSTQADRSKVDCGPQKPCLSFSALGAISFVLILALGILFPGVAALELDNKSEIGTLSETPPPKTPGPPLNLSFTPGPNFIDLAWQPPSYQGASSVTAYNIYRTTDFEYFTLPLATVDSGTLSYRDWNVTLGTSYLYSVRAVNSYGIGDTYSTGWAVPGITVPSEPKYLQALAGENTVWLSWELPDQSGQTYIQGYKVYRGTARNDMQLISSCGFWDVVAYYQDQGLNNGQIYFYQVTAFNSMGEGEVSNVVSAIPNWAPRNLTVDPWYVDGSRPVTIALTWQHPIHDYENVTGYKIIGTMPTQLISRESTYFSANVSGGFYGYPFRVVAVYQDGNEVASNEAYVVVPMPADIGDPYFLLPLVVALIVFLTIIAIAYIVEYRNRLK